MINFSQLLAEKTEIIIEQWVAAVRQDRQIESADNLSRPAIENHLSHVLSAMATVLSHSQENEIEPIVQASLYHGVLRAEQGFDPAEVAREYHLLRQVIFSVIEANLLTGTIAEGIRAVRLIDAVIDEAIAQCFKSYVDERLRELQQLQNQLILTNQELTRLIRANHDNLSVLAHELKTPLNSIIGYSELFLRHQQRIPEVKDNLPKLEHIEQVLRNGRHLLRLVNDTLELSRADGGKMQLHLMPTNVPSLIKSVMEVLEPLALSKELQMLVDYSLAPEQVLTDPLRLQQIITNLVSNGIRYTQLGKIQLNCQLLSDNQWAIAISDTGCGIAPEDQDRVFEPFFRAGSTEQSYAPGSTGLGLAIVSRLVKLLQGKIELVSQVGIGSTFTVTFPLEIQTSEITMTASTRGSRE
ncbi:MAG TPA: sensor histidine kinase [Cyanobacteria bacterium UBA8553]|nr:sensor histidine kinase [Cyanobacteria bacterium UBA8553]